MRLATTPLMIILCASPAAGQATQAMKSIPQYLAEAREFQTLFSAIQASDLGEVLSGPGPFTIFAPSDEAFAKLPEGTIAGLLEPENKDELNRILRFHVVPDQVYSAQLGLADGKEIVTMLEGHPLPLGLQGRTIAIGEGTATKVDIRCENGIIHVIDTVLMPDAR